MGNDIGYYEAKLYFFYSSFKNFVLSWSKPVRCFFCSADIFFFYSVFRKFTGLREDIKSLGYQLKTLELAIHIRKKLFDLRTPCISLGMNLHPNPTSVEILMFLTEPPCMFKYFLYHVQTHFSSSFESAYRYFAYMC